jgi:hypothetical protein
MYRYSLLCSYCPIVYFYLYIVSSVALLSSSVCRAVAPVPKRPFQVALGVPPFTFTHMLAFRNVYAMYNNDSRLYGTSLHAWYILRVFVSITTTSPC